MDQPGKKFPPGPRFYRFLLSIEPFFGRYFLILVCVGAGLVWYTLYTRDVVRRLQQDAVNVTETYTELIQAAISESMSNQQMNIVFDEIIQKTNIPIIITDTAWTPLMWKNIRRGALFGRRDVSPRDSTEPTLRFLQRTVADFKKLYEPKPLYLKQTSSKFGYLVFGNSDIIVKLSRIPLYEFTLVGLFILIIYLGFRSVRTTERSNLWVALARETAHQLGTPISSLMGWLEVVKSLNGPEAPLGPEEYAGQVNAICGHMGNDISRLRKITNRFSRIGSQPALAPCDIRAVLDGVIGYYTPRLPLLGKRIEIRHDYAPVPPVDINRELMEWVFENLLKNSADAMSRQDGLIEIKSEYVECDRIVRVYYSDNGKGIPWEDRRKVFAPGYSTKKRGWGLGLTLARRIVEDYHKGRIYVNWSQRGKGTVFCIDLPASDKPGEADGKRGSGPDIDQL